jgi:hypothetical protein
VGAGVVVSFGGVTFVMVVAFCGVRGQVCKTFVEVIFATSPKPETKCRKSVLARLIASAEVRAVSTPTHVEV